jgi:hypothetical protein
MKKEPGPLIDALEISGVQSNGEEHELHGEKGCGPEANEQVPALAPLVILEGAWQVGFGYVTDGGNPGKDTCQVDR